MRNPLSQSNQMLEPALDRLSDCADQPVSCYICPCRAGCVREWDTFIEKFSTANSSVTRQKLTDKFGIRLTEIFQYKTEQVEKQQIKGVVVWT